MNDNLDIIYSNKDDTKEKINYLLKHYNFSLKSLSKITNLDYTWLKNFVEGESSIRDLTTLDRLSLSNMIFFLSDGISMVNENDRIKGVIDVLISEYDMNYETIAIYAGIQLEELKNFITDPNSISYEKKYKLATVSLFLHYLFKKPSHSL